ncbi:FISUMP domain-containing protein [Fibrobacter sp. UWH4]|uniref:FISUMP domain-containing protein n=1 Tax=Fibrobacter sp. UWH4 TaxID=1896210 RepID=UPI000917D88B|nr:FISUMP domain-containing protein [Fibrobacter sp. UWH4]SHL84500.1 major paralogous domain-containing protein [Fibrobacter sp. UWH4]
MKKSFQRVIATLNLFQGKQSLTICLLAAFFALWGCDDSSSASSDETGVSSSSVESSDSSVTLSGASAESNGSSNETKDKSSSSENKSSSSIKETKNSSDSKSSSSVKTDDSSSSNKGKSSSSENSSSSEKQSSSSSEKQSSSSSVLPKSSSSVFEVDSARLCTPGYAYCNRDLGADSLHAGAYKKFKDTRNGREYYYLTINGKNRDRNAASVTVMAENLNVGEMIDGSKDQSDDSKIERYCYDNDTTNCEEYGGLYQWAEALQLSSECNTKSCAAQIDPDGDGFHQGICPKGWHLLTYDEFYIVVHADGNVNPLVEGVRGMSFGGHNYSGYGLIGGGMRITPSGNFKEKNEVAYWFYPGENEYENYSCGDDGYMGNTSKSLNTNVSYKKNGLSIRCVKDE